MLPLNWIEQWWRPQTTSLPDNCSPKAITGVAWSEFPITILKTSFWPLSDSDMIAVWGPAYGKGGSRHWDASQYESASREKMPPESEIRPEKSVSEDMRALISHGSPVSSCRYQAPISILYESIYSQSTISVRNLNNRHLRAHRFCNCILLMKRECRKSISTLPPEMS